MNSWFLPWAIRPVESIKNTVDDNTVLVSGSGSSKTETTNSQVLIGEIKHSPIILQTPQKRNNLGAPQKIHRPWMDIQISFTIGFKSPIQGLSHH